MLLMLHGSSEFNAQVRSKIENSDMFEWSAVLKYRKFNFKILFSFGTCATSSEVPSNVSTGGEASNF